MDRHRSLTALVLAGVLAACSPAPGAPASDAVDTNISFTNVTVEERADVGDPGAIRTAAPDASFVVLRFRVRNDGQTRAPVDHLPEVTLRGPDGRTFRHDPEATAAFRSEANSGLDPARSGDLNPGVAFTGGLVFELADSAWRQEGWRFQVEGAEQAIALPPPGL